MDWAKTIARWGEKHLSFVIWFLLYYRFDGTFELSKADDGIPTSKAYVPKKSMQTSFIDSYWSGYLY